MTWTSSTSRNWCGPSPHAITPTLGQTVYAHELISPLVAFYRSAEKVAGHGPKVVYNLLPPAEWGDQLPVRSSFAHAYPKALQDRVIANWHAYGFAETPVAT